MLDERKLKEIADFWEGDNWTTEIEEGSLWPKDPYGDLAQHIEKIFWAELILGGNHFDPFGKKTLMDNGYRVYAGDRDSFGILVACVEKDGKTFSFG